MSHSNNEMFSPVSGHFCIFARCTVATQNNTNRKCLIKNLFSSLSLGLFIVHDHSGGRGQWREVLRGSQGLEVVDDPADGLDVGVLGLPLVMAAVVSALHDVHATAEVWLLVHHPAEDGEKQKNYFMSFFLQPTV